MRLKPFALGAVACLCCASGAAAQSAAPAAGSARQYHARTSVTVVYDDNFARSSKALADQRGIKQQEYTLTPRVDFNIVQPFGRQLVYVSGGAGYQFHRENDNLDRVNANILAGYVATLGFCQASANTAYRAAQSDLAQLDTLRVKNLTQSTTVGAGVQCGRPQGIMGGVNVQRTENTNSAATEREANSDVENIAVQLGYGNQTIGQLGLVYSYASSQFPNRINPGRPIGDGFFAETFALTVQRQLGSRMKLGGSAGITKVKREYAPPGVDQKFTSNTYSANASYRLGDRLTIDLVGDRSVQPAGRPGKLYDVNTNGSISGAYRLGSRYLVTVGHRISDVDSNTDTTLARLVVTNSRTNSTFASVRYTQSRRASLSLDVRYDERNANLDDFDYKGMRVSISADVGF